MKKISVWAKYHKWSSRIIIIASFIIINILGAITGILIQNLALSIPFVFFFLLTAAYLIAIWLYPVRTDKRNKITFQKFYLRQKRCDLALGSIGFLMMVYIGNHQFSPLKSLPVSAAITSTNLQPADSSKNYKSLSEFSKMMKDTHGKTLKWKERKKLLKQQVRAIKRSDDLTDGSQIALIILCSLIAIGLLSLVVALACDLSCAGSDAAAVLVGVGGTALIALFLVLAIRGILRKGRKKEMNKVNNEPIKQG